MEKQEYQGYTGVWRRLKSGAAIFIRDGEDIKSAVRRNYNSQKLESKKKVAVDRENRAWEMQQAAKKDKIRAFREKGELSEEYDTAVKIEKSWKKEEDRARQERYDAEDEQQRVTSRNRFGMQIKKDQVDRLKEVGNVKQNQAEFENAYLKMVDKNKSGSEDEYFANSERFNAIEKKYRDLYGQEESNEMLRRSFETYKKGVEGSILTKQMTPKQKAEEIKKANSYTSQELKDKYGTDNVDLINAGKEKEDRVSLKQETSQTPKASTSKQMDYDAEVEKYYGSSSVESITADLEERKRRMEQDWYAPNDKETYQQWNEATERYLISRMRGKEKLLDKYQTPKQKAAEIDKINKMTRKELAEVIVDDQIARGVVKKENRDFQVNSRLKGLGAAKAMPKSELLKAVEDIYRRKK